MDELKRSPKRGGIGFTVEVVSESLFEIGGVADVEFIPGGIDGRGDGAGNDELSIKKNLRSLVKVTTRCHTNGSVYT